MDPVRRIAQIHSDVFGGCPGCEEYSGLSDDLDERVNHLIGHGWKVLHVGQETTDGMGGEPWQRTTVVLGEPE
jgi:hypothetical protein